MREAILVTGLKTQRVRCGKEVEYQIYDPLFATDGVADFDDFREEIQWL